MSLLDKVQTGKIVKPLRVMITGQAGVGKSTFAGGAPKPLFIDCEKRTEHLDVARLFPESWEDVINSMVEVYTLAKAGKCPYQTLVVDTLDHAELKLWSHLIKKYKCDTIEEVGGGYGKGYVAALEEWRRFATGIEKLRDVGINIVLIAHCEVKTFQNPEGDNWDKYVVKLNRKAGGLLTEMMDCIGFAKFEDFGEKKRGELKGKGISTGQRILCFAHSPAYDTKQGLNVPDQVSLTWNDFHSSITKTK